MQRRYAKLCCAKITHNLLKDKGIEAKRKNVLERNKYKTVKK